jgi:hypothetical protein
VIPPRPGAWGQGERGMIYFARVKAFPLTPFPSPQGEGN